MALTWVVPAGQYQRRQDPANDRSVVVAGTYHSVPRQPVGPFQAAVEHPDGSDQRRRRRVFRVPGWWVAHRGREDRRVAEGGGLAGGASAKPARAGDPGRVRGVRRRGCAGKLAGGDCGDGAGAASSVSAVGLRSAHGGGDEHRRGVRRIGVQPGQSVSGGAGTTPSRICRLHPGWDTGWFSSCWRWGCGLAARMRHAARAQPAGSEDELEAAPPSDEAAGPAGNTRTVLILALVGGAFAMFIYGASGPELGL